MIILLLHNQSSYGQIDSGAKGEIDFLSTGLPVLIIETVDKKNVESKFDYLKSMIVIIESGDTIMHDSVLIRGRGNSTWNQPKKQYKLKFYDGKDFFGFKKNKHFALVGNYVDKSLMRNAIGLKLSEILDFPWSPKGEYVELVINGDHLGTYMLCETVREGKNRISIDKTGFFVEDDWHYLSEPVYFVSKEYKYGFSFKYPDEDDLDEMSFQYIENTINSFECMLKDYESFGSHDYLNEIDVESFARYFYHANVLMNMDPNRWYVKYDNTGESKIQMGPPWDFEWCIGTGWYNGDQHRNPNHELVAKSYLTVIMDDPIFMKKVAELHKKYRERITNQVLSYYDILKDYLAKSAELNFKRWDILDEEITFHHKPCGSWLEEVNCDIDFFKNHQLWLDLVLDPYITGISEPLFIKNNSTYTIYGQRVLKAEKPGIYIINKQKIVVN